MAEHVGDTLDGRRTRDSGKRLAHHFAHNQFAQVLALQGESENLVFVNGADGQSFFKDRDLRDILFLHGFQRVENSLIRPRNHKFADFAGLPLGVDDFRGGDGHAGFDVATLAHPFVVVNLAQIAHAGIGKQRNDKIVRSKIFRQA